MPDAYGLCHIPNHLGDKPEHEEVPTRVPFDVHSGVAQALCKVVCYLQLTEH